MPASRIEAVDLAQGTVTIVGKLTDMTKHDAELLHVWLAQPGCAKRGGAGLAIDCLADVEPTQADGTAKFTLTAPRGDATDSEAENEAPVEPADAATDEAVGAPRANPSVVGNFIGGPATVSAIAVLVPNKQGSEKGAVTEVLQWSLTVTLPERVDEGQVESA